MLKRLRSLMVLGVGAVSVPAAAQDPPDEPASEQSPAAPAESEPAPEASETSEEPAPDESEETAAPAGVSAELDAQKLAAPAEPEPKAEKEPEGFRTFVSGYFRAPMSIGISPRRDPGDPTGPERTQLSYGPTRTVDSNYYSFAYTRLQEQDWAEVFIHAEKEHVKAVVGWMGYWLQSAGFRNYDAAWVPGMAYLTLDTDLEVGSMTPNVAFTGGAFWPSFGYFEKYDTLTLGRFRHLGEQLKLTLPFGNDLTLTLTQGFGTGRDGSFNTTVAPPYQATVGLALLHYEHVRIQYEDYVDAGLHFNHQWTRDPNLTQRGSPGQSYPDAREAKFTTAGGELTLSAPIAGRLWVSPSYTRVRNGWALAEAGTEIMHSIGAAGFAGNYLAWDQSAVNSTGTGSSINLGFSYENSLSTITGKERGSVMPEVTLSVFGLFIDAKLELPPTSAISRDNITQMKYGADVSVQALKWLGFMLRWDEVNYDLDNPGYVFSAVTPRVTFSSNFLSSESIYLQYSRYRYGDRMVIAGRWPWGQPLVAGSHITQGGPYGGQKPDMDVIKLQASVAF